MHTLVVEHSQRFSTGAKSILVRYQKERGREHIWRSEVEWLSWFVILGIGRLEIGLELYSAYGTTCALAQLDITPTVIHGKRKA